MNNLTVIVSPTMEHISIATVKDFEIAIKENTDWKFKNCLNSRILASFVRRIPFSVSYIPSRKSYFSILMTVHSIEKKTLPYFLMNSPKAIYLFDIWEHDIDYVKKIVRKYKISYVFSSSKESSLRLQSQLPENNVIWLPEAINIDDYESQSYSKKTIDVLQFGRKHELYHKMIVKKLKESGKNYLFEKKKGEVVFPTMHSFYDGLSKTKISICFPSNITHPERGGSISTMTQRYLQSIASRCLIIGEAPEEMKELFGYNPVIKADMNNPNEQLESILYNFESYIPLIEKNYKQVKENHQWCHRAIKIKNHLC